jgi:hypothetical protein
VNDAPLPLRRVRLLRLPVRLWVAAKQHNDELLREFALITTATAGGTEADIPQRLIDVIGRLRQQYGRGNEERDAQLFAAHDAGVEHLDFELELPLAAADALEHIGALLDEADAFCQQGRHLLTLATPPELLTYRRWFLGEMTAQLRGAAPTPWPAAQHAAAP